MQLLIKCVGEDLCYLSMYDPCELSVLLLPFPVASIAAVDQDFNEDVTKKLNAVTSHV